MPKNNRNDPANRAAFTPERDDFAPLPRGIHHLGMTVPDIDAATTFLRAALGARVCYDGVTAQDTPREGAELERILGLPLATPQMRMALFVLTGVALLGFFLLLYLILK